MKNITIISAEAITEDIVRKIRDIFAESECPNESMLASIPDFTSFDERAGIVRLKDGQYMHEMVIAVDDTE
ncbi:hypothetical protein [uncultured Selenomonas sp.]|uniref:hypothetical protein n=1 Tax=uncultured Selenomonas sp. TaxID=159275 RepID=UPI0028E2D451|nr:hypothetical protein [uncultured Selenomonas sp.]